MREYDVVLSFAGEDRAYVEKIAFGLKECGVRVFYDKFEPANLWGKDLYLYLNDIYKNRAKYCIVFISKYYKIKAWTRHEYKSALSRAFIENKEYILPLYIDDTQLEGLNNTIGYIRKSEFTSEEIIELILNKLGEDFNMFYNCKNLKDLLNVAIKRIYKYSGTDYNQIILYSTIGSHSSGLIVIADIISAFKQRYRTVAMSGIISSTYQSGKTNYISDVTKESNYFNAVEETKSELIVPIRSFENVIGVINIESEQIDYFSEEVIKKIEIISNHLGIMLNKLGISSGYKELPYVSYLPFKFDIKELNDEEHMGNNHQS